ncbi:LuxR C-terminal-related transcriptional regulator [Streptomyces sp. NPDC059851]|uniref:LuxR C-terminal-related transcriptional regulator n=1 Tax=Streptomyces sp. NPDC059851 TaxID=3346971 RepID=UPI00364ABA68
MLTLLGLDRTTEAVYRAMLAHPGDGVAGLCTRLDLTEEAVRSGLDQLSELALVRPSYEEPGRLRAVSPEVGMEMLLARQQAELAAQQQRIEASRAAAAQLISEYADLRPAASEPGVEHLVGLDRIRERLTLLHREVEREVMVFAPDGEQTPENLEASRPLDEALLKRGIRMRTVYLDSVRNSPHTVAYAEWLGQLGRQARTVPTLPIRMIITDRSTAVIPVNSEDTSAGAVVLTGHGTLTALCALFESVWEAAKPFGEKAHRDDESGLTDTESTALKLLADGFTDEAIAKRLGVSHRTARRVATGLMERLGARSRFEAGVRAVRQGWLA